MVGADSALGFITISNWSTNQTHIFHSYNAAALSLTTAGLVTKKTYSFFTVNDSFFKVIRYVILEGKIYFY